MRRRRRRGGGGGEEDEEGGGEEDGEAGEEKGFHQQIALKFKEQTNEMLLFEHGCVW
jgi:hypothetical protein